MKKALFILSFLFLLFFSFSTALAGDGSLNNGTCASGTPAGTVCLQNPLNPTNSATGVNDPQQLLGKIINTVLGVVGSLALIMFIFGGLTWMTSAGAPDKVKKGRDIIIWSVVGLFIIFASYALLKFFLGTITGM